MTPEAYKQGLARCRYEAVADTAGYSSGRVAPTMVGAIAQGLGEGMAIGLRRSELFALCLEANGYSKQIKKNSLAASYASLPAPVADPPLVPQPSAFGARKVEPVPAKPADHGRTLSEMASVVQVLAESGFPLVGTPTRFMQKENRSYYEAWGTGGRLKHVVCENGVCRIRSIYD